LISITDNADNPPELITVLSEIRDAIMYPSKVVWLDKKQASAYLNMNPRTFQKLIDADKVKSHSLYEIGVALERFNKDELDTALKGM